MCATIYFAKNETREKYLNGKMFNSLLEEKKQSYQKSWFFKFFGFIRNVLETHVTRINIFAWIL